MDRVVSQLLTELDGIRRAVLARVRAPRGHCSSTRSTRSPRRGRQCFPLANRPLAMCGTVQNTAAGRGRTAAVPIAAMWFCGHVRTNNTLPGGGSRRGTWAASRIWVALGSKFINGGEKMVAPWWRQVKRSKCFLVLNLCERG